MSSSSWYRSWGGSWADSWGPINVNDIGFIQILSMTGKFKLMAELNITNSSNTTVISNIGQTQDIQLSSENDINLSSNTPKVTHGND